MKFAFMRRRIPGRLDGKRRSEFSFPSEKFETEGQATSHQDQGQEKTDAAE
jgi:hypothetical protein